MFPWAKRKKVFYNKQIPNIYNHRSAARECRAGNRPFFVSTSNPHTFTGDTKNISFHLRKQYRHIPPTGYYVKGFWGYVVFSCQLNREISCQLNRVISCQLNTAISYQLNRVFSWQVNTLFSCHNENIWQCRFLLLLLRHNKYIRAMDGIRQIPYGVS